MTWLFPRVVVAMVLVLIGAALGALIGSLMQSPTVGAMLGAVAANGLAVLIDGLRANRLVGWLRGDDAKLAPRDPGLWGEAAYRIERALRMRDRALVQERERLSQFLSAIQASPNGVLLLDAHDQIQWLNRMAAVHFGLDPAGDLQQRVTNLVRAPAFVAYLQGDKFDESVSFLAPGGQTTLSVLVRSYGDGQRIVLSQDITERERAEAMRRDFVANVSHEIRTPLTVLSGFVETIATLPLTEAERRRVLGLMEQQTHRMQTLVEDLLTLAKLEGSPPPPSDRNPLC